MCNLYFSMHFISDVSLKSKEYYRYIITEYSCTNTDNIPLAKHELST